MSKSARIREEVKKLNPIDDLMFKKMAEDRQFIEEILRVILEDPGLSVLESQAQYTGTNLQGRSVILDAKCVTGDGRHINIEVQKSDNDDHQKRVRYNGAVLTTNITDPGTQFKDVPDVCIVFIAKFDLFKADRALYHIDRVVRETGEVVNNGFEEIYVNAIAKDGTPVSRLMEIFVEDKAYDEKQFPVTTAMKKRYKKTEQGDMIMNESLRALIEEERAEGKAEGHAEGRAEGHAEGRAEGHAEGHAEGEANVFQTMQMLGISPELIAQVIAAVQNQKENH